MNKNDYKKYVEKREKRSDTGVKCFKAFVTGGIICCIGQGFKDLYLRLGAGAEISPVLASVTLIFIAGLLTGIGLFDKIAKFGGAGALVPISGFANAITAPAIDAKSEGFIMGVGAQMFVIAGPVIVYGTAASVIYGIIYFIIK